MEKLQDWIKKGFINPRTTIQKGRGIIKYFVKSQVEGIGLFNQLLSIGIDRHTALLMMNGVHQNRYERTQQGIKKEPKYIALKLNHRRVERIDLLPELYIEDQDDEVIIVCNFYKILNKVEKYINSI